MALDLDADTVDDHRAADARAVQQRDIGGDPAAERVADDGHVGHVELVEQRHVGRREVLRGGQ
jgi:hypothetical protein